MSTTLHAISRAQPLRAPPFRCHLAHAVPHAGQRPRGTRKVGAQGLCMRNGTRGRAHTQWGRGAASLWCACFSCRPHVVRGPIEAHGVGQKGEGRGQPRAERLRGTPTHKRRVWCLRRPTHPRGPSHSPPFMRDPPSPCPNGGAFSPPHSHRQGGAEGWQRQALRSLSCSAGWDQGRGAYLFRAALQSPFAHRDGLARTPRTKGGGNRVPPLSMGGAKGVRTGRGHAERGGGCYDPGILTCTLPVECAGKCCLIWVAWIA